MLNSVMRAALVVMVCAMVGNAEAAARPPQATTRNVTTIALLAGGLEFEIVGDTVRLTARGDGRASRFGGVSAEATWSPAIDNVLALLAGQIDELTINTGAFAAEFDNGDTIAGTLRGTIRPRHDGTFALEADFVATHGTGHFAGVTGGGSLRAVDDLTTMEFRAMLHAKLSVPR